MIIGGLVGVLGTSASGQVPPPQCGALCPGLSALEPVGPFLLNFDENGNATIKVGSGPTTPLVGTLVADPTIGPCVGCAPVLAYALPEPVVSGTVTIQEPGGGLSDALRFTDSGGIIDGGATNPLSTIMIYYSDLPEPGSANPDKADTGFPANLTLGNFFVGPTEIGPEGNNFFDYRPAGVPAPANNEYIGISDAAVPEPASLALLGSAIAVTGLIIRRRRRHHVDLTGCGRAPRIPSRPLQS